MTQLVQKVSADGIHLPKELVEQCGLTGGTLRADLARLEANQQRLEDALGRVQRREDL